MHWLWRHAKPLFLWSDKKRPFGFLFISALAVGLPVVVGAWLQQFALAVIASMGGLVILYMQPTHFRRRMLIMMLCSVGFALSFAVGVLTSFNDLLSALTLTGTIFLVILGCRFYALPPPGSFFFILVACMSRTLPFDITLAAERTGILLFGCLGACLLALLYSLLQFLQQSPPRLDPPVQEDRRVVAILLESAVISLFIGGGYLLALLINLDNPYWVPISTAAIMQGATFRAVWHRNIHRIFGTILGMGLTWLIFSFSPNAWVLGFLVMLLSFLIEALITRNYGLAVIFITPMTLILADFVEASVALESLLQARLIDIILGSCIGYVGGWVIHQTPFFYRLEQRLLNWVSGLNG